MKILWISGLYFLLTSSLIAMDEIPIKTLADVSSDKTTDYVEINETDHKQPTTYTALNNLYINETDFEKAPLAINETDYIAVGKRGSNQVYLGAITHVIIKRKNSPKETILTSEWYMANDIVSIGISPNKKKVVAGLNNGVLSLFDLELNTHYDHYCFPQRSPKPISSVRFHNDNLIIFTDEDKILHLFDTTSHKLVSITNARMVSQFPSINEGTILAVTSHTLTKRSIKDESLLATLLNHGKYMKHALYCYLKKLR